MKATIERVRLCKKSELGYKVFCKEFEIETRKRYTNGEFVVLIDSIPPKLLKIQSIMSLVEDGKELSIGEDVTEYVPEGLG